MNGYKRTENGKTTEVTQKVGMDEINAAMFGSTRRTVRTMSSINRTDYAIEYKDGRKVRLELIEIVPPTGDRIEPRTQTTAAVTLSDGKVYIVDTRITRKHPKNKYGVSCIADHTSYYSSRNGQPFGATRFTSENNKPKSVGGRIWALLTTYGTGA